MEASVWNVREFWLYFAIYIIIQDACLWQLELFVTTLKFFSPDDPKWWILLMKWIRIWSYYQAAHLVLCLELRSSGVFRIMSIIFDGVFLCEVVNCFHKKISIICDMLCGLEPFVQFKKREKHSSLSFSRF